MELVQSAAKAAEPSGPYYLILLIVIVAGIAIAVLLLIDLFITQHKRALALRARSAEGKVPAEH
jgi:hypothetical protein